MEALGFRVLVVLGFFGFFVLNVLQEKSFRRAGVDTRGTLPLPRRVFLLGKLSMVIVWAMAFLQAVGVPLRMVSLPPEFFAFSAVVFFFALVVIACAYFNLGEANALGLPEAATTLRSRGLYRISRNPVYLGFFLMSIAAALYAANVGAVALVVFSTMVHHRIVLVEEVFLAQRFGVAYTEYQKKVRRYL